MSKHNTSYRKKQEENHSQGYFSKIQKAITNSNFWAQSSLFSKGSFWKSKTQERQQIYIMGHLCRKRDEAIQKLQKIIWFTYRDKNSKLRDLTVDRQFSSDTGWGCVLRVGQMTLANALKRYFEQRKVIKSEFIQTENNFDIESVTNILYAFLDDEGSQQRYSLKKILQFSGERYGKKPGQWFNFPQISFSLQQLQNKKPMKGADHLKILTFNHGVIFLKYVFESLHIPKCNCTKHRNICPFCHKSFLNRNSMRSDRVKTQSSGMSHQSQIKFSKNKKGLNVSLANSDNLAQNSVLILLPVLLGYKNMEDKYFQGMLEVLQQPFSMGIMAGRPRKALYFVGKQDPHRVAESPTKITFERLFKTFFCKEDRRIQQMNIDPSVCFAFYLNSIDSLIEFLEFIDRMKLDKLISFGYMWDCPQSSDIIISGVQEDNGTQLQFSEFRA